jgi:hypothetical protein
MPYNAYFFCHDSLFVRVVGRMKQTNSLKFHYSTFPITAERVCGTRLTPRADLQVAVFIVQ